MEIVGAICFGLVVGWLTYRTLRRKEEITALTDLATVIGVVGGAAITTLFPNDEENLFAFYAIGLLVGFFGYLIVNLVVYGKDETGTWMG
jgi:uncharacterized membrane protein YeaQ/YmgE (transglycosylase-associated protein family)